MKTWTLIITAALGMLTAAGLTSCKSTDTSDKPTVAAKDDKKNDDKAKAEAEVPVDLSFLLSMDFAEAKTLSAQSTEMAPFYKIAADSVDITKTTPEGTPKRVRGKGKVFIEMNFLVPAKALCQEILVSEDEVILRGKPILQRGLTTIEGVDDTTVFYMYGTRLRVIGAHRITRMGQVIGGRTDLGLPVLGAWSEAPNPLLPPLTEGTVPDSVRNELMQAAEAEAIHQQTRAKFGPADAPKTAEPAKVDPKAKPTSEKPDPKAKPTDIKDKKGKTEPPPATPPEKKGFFSRFRSEPKNA